MEVLEIALAKALDMFRPATATAEAHENRIREELTRLEAEVGRLASAIAAGGDLSALLESRALSLDSGPRASPPATAPLTDRWCACGWLAAENRRGSGGGRQRNFFARCILSHTLALVPPIGDNMLIKGPRMNLPLGARPLRIYLDQKDFGRIADALRRQDQDSPELLAYNRLKACIATDRVRVYFSFVHVIEALRFGDVQSPTAVAYCEVVDTLTQGHCIRAVPYLRRAELELALSDVFSFATSYSRDGYPYGRHADALVGHDDTLLFDGDFVQQLVDSILAGLKTIRESVRALPADALLKTQPWLPRGMTAQEFSSIILTGSEDDLRAVARAFLSNRDIVQQFANSMPDSALDELNRTWPGIRWSREHVVTALAGSPEDRETLGRQFFAGVMSFSNLIVHYSRTQPDISSIGHTFDDDEVNLIGQLRNMQRFEPLRAAILGTPTTWDRDISRDVGTRYLESHRDDIRSYATTHGFAPEGAERALSADGFARLPYTRALMLWLKSYLSRHRGTEHARIPEANDLRDLLHCVNAPYVDILVTERFSADVSRPLASAFRTRVFRSLKELTPHLPSDD